MEQLAQSACFHLVTGYVHATSGIGGHPQQRSKPCPERGDADGRRRPGQHRTCGYVPDWAEILRVQHRFNWLEGVDR